MSNQLKIWIWLASMVLFVVTVAASAARLPDQVATHFNAAGNADAWMSRSNHLMYFGAFGVLFSSFFVAVFYAIRFLPPSLLNVSNSKYWRSPEHYPEACQFMFQHSFVLSTLASLFVAGLQLLIVRANLPKEPRMEIAPTLVLSGFFLLGILYWSIGLLRFFRNTGSPVQG